MSTNALLVVENKEDGQRTENNAVTPRVVTPDCLCKAAGVESGHFGQVWKNVTLYKATPTMASDPNKGMIEKFEVDGKKWIFPVGWKDQCEIIRNFKMRPDDVWIMTQPRSGTTLTQELVWLLKNNLDFESAKKFHLADRSPSHGLIPETWKDRRIIRPSVENPKVLESVPVDKDKYSFEVYADLPSPRVFKTHFALSVHKGILDSGCKVIYMFRNPKDVLVSQGRFVCCGKNPFVSGTVQEIIRAGIHNEPSFLFQPYWPHVHEAWAQRHHPNLLFMYYEEYRTDLPAAIKKIAAFLGKKYSDEQLARLADHLDIENFRKNPMVNVIPGWEDRISNFIGKGRVGGWNEVLTPELEREVDRWIEENTKGTDVALPYLKK